MHRAFRTAIMSEHQLKDMVWHLVAMIPHGKVATYGQIARLCGYPSHARYVGQILKKLPEDSCLPWHRVVNARGEIALMPGSEAYSRQRRRLEQEGIRFANGKITLRLYLWDGISRDAELEN